MLAVKGDIPEFLLRIIPRIEKYSKTSHLYESKADKEKLDKIKSKTTQNKLSYIDKFKAPELTAALKIFFELLPDPLIPEEIFQQFLGTILKKYNFVKIK